MGVVMFCPYCLDSPFLLRPSVCLPNLSEETDMQTSLLHEIERLKAELQVTTSMLHEVGRGAGAGCWMFKDRSFMDFLLCCRRGPRRPPRPWFVGGMGKNGYLGHRCLAN